MSFVSALSIGTFRLLDKTPDKVKFKSHHSYSSRHDIALKPPVESTNTLLITSVDHIYHEA